MRNKIIAPLLILGIFLVTLGGVEFVQTRTAHAAWFDNNYTYCQKWTMAAGGNSGGVATTTTAAFTLVATSTMTTMAATSSSGHISQLTDYTVAAASSTPLDVAFTNGTDCNAAGGSLIPFYFEDYNKTTGAFAARLKYSGISSTTPKTVLMYYGSTAATNQSSESTTYGGLNEKAVYSFGAAGDMSTSTIKDASGNNNTGTLKGATSTVVTIGTGQTGQSLSFDGSTSRVQVPNSSSINIVGPVTMGVWVYPKVSNVYQSLIVRADSGGGTRQYTYYLHASGVGEIYSEINAFTVGAFVNPNWAVNRWNQIYETADGTNVKFYINGVLAGTTVNAALPTSKTFTLDLGSQDESSFTLNGYLDNARVYARALHVMDIKTIYNNESNSAVFWTYGAEETQTSSTPYIPHVRVDFLNARADLIGARFDFY